MSMPRLYAPCLFRSTAKKSFRISPAAAQISASSGGCPHMNARIFFAQDLADFLARFATEDACVAALRGRFEEPVACHDCKKHMSFRADRRAFVCTCGHSRSVTRGTPFYRLKLPLKVAFHALG